MESKSDSWCKVSLYIAVVVDGDIDNIISRVLLQRLLFISCAVC